MREFRGNQSVERHKRQAGLQFPLLQLKEAHTDLTSDDGVRFGSSLVPEQSVGQNRL